jgi:hypothetical protein
MRVKAILILGVIHGIDISEDGIAVAKQKYLNCLTNKNH